MKLEEIVAVVDGQILVAPPSELNLTYGCASDLMSDVLNLIHPKSLLITGLVNVQSVRTAEMADLPAILFVRAKSPPPETLQLAKELGIAVMVSPYRMFDCCGRLFQAGLRGLGKVQKAP